MSAERGTSPSRKEEREGKIDCVRSGLEQWIECVEHRGSDDSDYELVVVDANAAFPPVL